MARSPHHVAAPSLTHLAELIHQATSLAEATLVSVELRQNDLSLGTWPIPADAEHPADPLVGFVAPARWDVIGLSSAGRIIDLTNPEAPAPGPVSVTVLADRTGAVASVVGPPGGVAETMAEAPSGWVADVLARTLRLGTPAPTDRLALCVETAWLDTLAGVVLARPGSIRAWPTIARLHPLHPPGQVLPAALLAVEAEALDLESSWHRIRELWEGGYDRLGHADRSAGSSDQAAQPAGCTHPPGGHVEALDRWFDDGAFSRWVQRNQPPPDALLPAVLDALPHDVGAQLVDALVTIAVP